MSRAEAEKENQKEENQIIEKIEKEIVKQMLKERSFAVPAFDIEGIEGIENEIYNKYAIIAGELLTLQEFKNVFTEDQINMLNIIHEKINSVKLVSKLIKIMYEERSCTTKNSAIKLLLEKAQKFFIVEPKVVKWNARNYCGITDFIIRDSSSDEKLVTIRKEVYYCNYCVNDRDQDQKVYIGIQKCEKFSFK